jgi:hypothetical protein
MKLIINTRPEFPTLPLVEKIEWPDQPYSHINQKFYFLAAKSLGLFCVI